MIYSYWFWGGIAAAVLFGAYLSYPIFRAIAIDKDLMRKTVPYEQHPQNPTSFVLVAGDSTAVGTGSEDPTLSTAGRLGNRYPTTDIENISENGLKVAGLAEKLHALPTKHYNLILLQIGANDVIRFTPLEKVRLSLQAVLQMATEKADRVILLTSGDVGLAPIFRRPLSSVYTSRTRAVRAIFIEEIQKYPTATYIDLFKEAKDDVFKKDIPRFYASDLLHLSGEGYGVWFSEIQKNITVL